MPKSTKDDLTPRTKNMLNMAESFILAELVKQTYVSSKLSNKDFADKINFDEKARMKFRFDVTPSNVHAVITALGIPDNSARPATPEDVRGLTSRVAALEDQLSKLVNFMVSKGYDK
jgi:hypothetical protein